MIPSIINRLLNVVFTFLGINRPVFTVYIEETVLGLLFTWQLKLITKINVFSTQKWLKVVPFYLKSHHTVKDIKKSTLNHQNRSTDASCHLTFYYLSNYQERQKIKKLCCICLKNMFLSIFYTFLLTWYRKMVKKCYKTAWWYQWNTCASIRYDINRIPFSFLCILLFFFYFNQL